MKRVLPPLNALRAFEAAGRLGSFKDAAAELHVTQGAVSQQIRLLEQWLDAPLFERQNRRVVLTDAATTYLNEIGPLFERLVQASQRYGVAGPESRTLRVNALATFTVKWLLPRLGSFLEAHPGVDVKIETSGEPVEAIRQTYDVVIRGGPDTFYGYTMRPFLSEERIPVCSPALLKRARLKTPDDLANHAVLHSTSLPRVWSDWLAKANATDVVPASSITFDHFYLTLQAAVEGLGIAMGPTALIADDLQAGRLVIPFKRPYLPSRRYCTYVADEKADDELVILFRAWLEQQGALVPTAQAR